MRKASNLLLVGIVAVLLGALVIVPVMAQEVGPGEGGIIIDSAVGTSGADTLNPIFCLDVICDAVVGLMVPSLIAVDPQEGVWKVGIPGALAESAELSDDNLVWTFHLRDDMFWTDGTPITAKDVLYGWDAMINSPESELTFYSSWIKDVQAPDDHTVVVTMQDSDCRGLVNAGAIQPLPSHVLPADVTELINSDQNLNPTVTSGPFQFGEYIGAGEQVTLLPNQDYPDPTNPAGVIPTGYIMKLIGDANIQLEQFLAGEITYLERVVNQARLPELREMGKQGTIQTYEFSPGRSYNYLALNYADPDNPQNGVDESGNLIDQGHHPLFGDVRVRHAIWMAIDLDGIISGVLGGEGERMRTPYVPGTWAHNDDIPLVEYDPEGALALLAEAGWVDDDGDPSTPLVATEDALYAEPGATFEFDLNTNAGNPIREAIGVVVQDQLSQIGIKVNFQALDFNVFYDEVVAGEGFDAVIAGWRNGYPYNPDQTQIFGIENDVVGETANFTSWQNKEADDLMQQAAFLPGCDQAERKKLYDRVQEFMYEDAVYVPLYTERGFFVYSGNLQGNNPVPGLVRYDLDGWNLAE